MGTTELDIIKMLWGVKVSISAQKYSIGNSTTYDIKKQSKELKVYAGAGETNERMWQVKNSKKTSSENSGSKTNVLMVSLSLGSWSYKRPKIIREKWILRQK